MMPGSRTVAPGAGRRGTIPSIILALVLGFLTFWLVQEVRVTNLVAATAAAREEGILTSLIGSTYTETDTLTAEVSQLQSELAAQAPDPARTVALLSATRRLAGLTPVAGSGVRVWMEDAKGPRYPGEPAEFELVHDQYVLHVVGLLEAAGASAVSINGQRFVSTTAVFCAGPTIRVNGINEGSPFVISAVGPTQTLLAALARDPDVQGWSELVRLHYHAVPHLDLPALETLPRLNYATAGGHNR
jgi:uncharacterized protein YlxW (UPF0749 family)